MSMKLRKNLGRIATAFVATAMLASLSAVPASAETNTKLTSTENSFSFQAGIKHNKDGDTPYVPDVDVIYTLEAVDEVPFENEKLAYVGNEDAILDSSDKAAAFDGTQDADNVTFSFDMNEFDAPGIYYYELTSTVPTVTGLQAADNTYIVKVYVKNNDAMTGYEIYGVTMYNKMGDYESPEDTDDAKISDLNGGTSGTGDYAATYEAKTLTLTKKLDGDMANMSDTFGFDIVISDPDVEKYASQVKYSVNGTEATAPVQFKDDGTATVTVPANGGIGNGDSIVVYGIPATADVTITESDNGYNPVNGEITNDYETSWENANEDVDSDKMATAKIDDTKTVTVTNAKESVSPTGIVMNVAPYALLVVVAAGACFVFLRKRRED